VPSSEDVVEEPLPTLVWLVAEGLGDQCGASLIFERVTPSRKALCHELENLIWNEFGDFASSGPPLEGHGTNLDKVVAFELDPRTRPLGWGNPACSNALRAPLSHARDVGQSIEDLTRGTIYYGTRRPFDHGQILAGCTLSLHLH